MSFSNQSNDGNHLNSASTTRYLKISNELRKLITDKYDEGESIVSIARNLKISRSTVCSICRLYDKTGEFSIKPHGGGRRPMFSSLQKEKICEWVDEDALLTLKKLKEKVDEEFSISCSLSTVDRILKEFHYSVKRAYPVPVARNTSSTIEKRYEYAQAYRSLEETVRVEDIVFIDEVGFQVVTRPKQARAKKGQTAYVAVSAARSRNISVLAACSKNGGVHHIISKKAFNGETFLEAFFEIRSVH